VLKKIKTLLYLLLSKKKVCVTEQDRSDERIRRIAQTSAVSMIARLINILSGLLTVPLTLPYLGLEQFGIWMALTGFVAFLTFTDLGISIGLQTALSRCDGSDDRKRPSFYVSNALFMILNIVIILFLVTYFILPLYDLTHLIKLESTNYQVLLLTTQFLIITFAIGLPASIIQRIFEAYQFGLYSNSLLILGRLLSLLSVFFCINLEYSLHIMVMLYMGLPFIIMLLGGVYLFATRKWLRPNLLKIRYKYIKEIAGVGFLASLAQVGASIMSTGPLLLLSSIYGAAAIVPFAITQRLLGVVSTLLSVVLSPLWPAYTEAMSRGDNLWVKATFKKTIKLSIIAVLPFFIIFTFSGQWIIKLWSNDLNAVPSFDLLFVCNIWMVLFAGIRVFSMFLNGLGRFKGQSLYGLLLPILAMIVGYNISTNLSMAFCLAIVILVGELGRLTLMALESRWCIKRLFNEKIN
jgi:O-antigen/teichoic acid export membrane protein